jgi:hypothetical protein
MRKAVFTVVVAAMVVALVFGGGCQRRISKPKPISAKSTPVQSKAQETGQILCSVEEGEFSCNNVKVYYAGKAVGEVTPEVGTDNKMRPKVYVLEAKEGGYILQLNGKPGMPFKIRTIGYSSDGSTIIMDVPTEASLTKDGSAKIGFYYPGDGK